MGVFASPDQIKWRLARSLLFYVVIAVLVVFVSVFGVLFCTLDLLVGGPVGAALVLVGLWALGCAIVWGIARRPYWITFIVTGLVMGLVLALALAGLPILEFPMLWTLDAWAKVGGPPNFMLQNAAAPGKSSYVRLQVLKGVESDSVPPEEAVPILRSALRGPMPQTDNEREVVNTAIEMLRKLGAAGAPAVPELTALLASPEIQPTAAEALGELGDKAHSAAPQLQQMMRDHKSVAAACALCRIAPAEYGKEAAAVLAADFEGGNLTDRWYVWYLMNKLEPLDSVRDAFLPVTTKRVLAAQKQDNPDNVSAALLATHILYRMHGTSREDLLSWVQKSLNYQYLKELGGIYKTPIEYGLDVLRLLGPDGNTSEIVKQLESLRLTLTERRQEADATQVKSVLEKITGATSKK